MEWVSLKGPWQHLLTPIRCAQQRKFGKETWKVRNQPGLYDKRVKYDWSKKYCTDLDVIDWRRSWSESHNSSMEMTIPRSDRTFITRHARNKLSIYTTPSQAEKTDVLPRPVVVFAVCWSCVSVASRAYFIRLVVARHSACLPHHVTVHTSEGHS